MTLRPHRTMTCTAGLILAYAVVSFTCPPGAPLAAFGDITQLLLLVLASAIMVANAVSNRGQTRLFWSLMAVGCFMWTANQAMWTFYEVVLRRALPDPFVGDVILFIHVVPLMAAVALRPHHPQGGQKLYFSTLNFLMLLVWWMFLYEFIVFPDEYIVLDRAVYSRSYDLLYLVENLALLAILGMLASNTGSAWKRIYWNLFVASAIYSLSSEAMNAAIARGQYYTGNWYDIPFITSICWMIWAGLLARELKPTCEPAPSGRRRWRSLAPQIAMLAILSLPVLGYWAWLGDDSPPRIREFRILVTLAAMLVLGFFVFIRQYLMDRELVRLLEESRQSLENLKRLQTQLV